MIVRRGGTSRSVPRLVNAFDLGTGEIGSDKVVILLGWADHESRDRSVLRFTRSRAASARFRQG